MPEMIISPLFWILLLIFQLGLTFYIVGVADGDDESVKGTVTSFIGVVITISSVIASWLNYTWIGALAVFILGLVTQSLIAYPLAYMYWKSKYKPKFLTMKRFQNLIATQDKKIMMSNELRYFIDIHCNLAVEKELVTKEKMAKYVEEIVKSFPNYIAYEIFSSIEVLSYYLEVRTKSNLAMAFLKVSKELGMLRGVQKTFTKLSVQDRTPEDLGDAFNKLRQFNNE